MLSLLPLLCVKEKSFTMPPEERFPPDDPRAWLSRARGHLVRADEPSDDVFFEDLCFDAQQAAEKALKALCIHRSLEFPYVPRPVETDYVASARGGDDSGRGARSAGRLTRYAVETRYPGLSEPVTEDEHEKAVTLAEQTVRWVEQRVEHSSETDGDDEGE